MSRTGGFPRSAACLRERTYAILEEWEREVRERHRYPPAEPSSPVLRNDIPDMLSALAHALVPPAVEPVSDRSPYEHALQRYSEDVPLARLVEEYRVLRSLLFDALAKGAVEELPGAWPLISSHIDRAIEEAVTAYAKQRTRWLSEREQELETLIEDLPVGVAVAEAPSGRVVRTNHELVRIQAGIAEARTVSDVAALGVTRADGTALAPEELPIARALRGEEVGPEELRVTAPSGAVIAVDVRAKPIFGPHDGVRAAVVIASDVSDRVRARAERQLFASTLGHDVRSPISTIRLAAQRLEQIDAPDQVRKLSGGIVRSARRLTDLVGELLELAKTLEGPVELRRQAVDLSELTRELVAEKRAVWGEDGVRVRAPRSVVGNWDRQRLARIVENLVENARQHGEPGEGVEVEVAQQGETASLAVSSGGAPIAEEHAERLFEPYTRADGGRGPGSGLGLYIVKELAEAHGGRVVMTAAEGRITFRVVLPLSGGESSFDRVPGAS